MNEYVLICSNQSGPVVIGVDLNESCVNLYGSMWICTKLHDAVLICVYFCASIKYVRFFVNLSESEWISADLC